MGLKIAVANGNWSNPATWNNGTLPQLDDTVASNNFTVTIDQSANIALLTNTAQAVISTVPVMTSNTAPSGIASASGEWNTSNQAWRAFDGSTSNGWLSNSLVSWLAYEFASPRIISQYVVLGGGTTAAPRDWTFEAWNGTSWIVLHTVTGNTNTTTYTGSFTNTTAYSRYRINITANNGQASYSSIVELQLIAPGDSTVAAVAGGGFVINSSVTITCSSVTGMQPGPVTLLTLSAPSGQTVNINSNLTNSSTTNSVNVISKTGSCTLNLVGDSVRLAGSGSSRHGLVVFAPGTINFVGNVFGWWAGSHGILMTTGSAGAVLNIVGDINPNKSGPGGAQNAQYLVVSSVCTVNVTGNIYGGAGNDAGISIGAAATIYITGNVYGGQSLTSSIGSGATITSGQAHFLSIIGTIFAQHTVPFETCGVFSTSSAAINLFSGPFVSGPYGSAPIACYRMHLIPNAASYFEFRDETTNGALSPGAIAPAARLVQPGYAVDAPTPANVRAGVIYASGTLGGTCQMPAPAAVAFGVPVDNTTGTAVLSPNDIWNLPESQVTTFGSIGVRIKNAATQQAVAAIINAFN